MLPGTIATLHAIAADTPFRRDVCPDTIGTKIYDMEIRQINDGTYVIECVTFYDDGKPKDIHTIGVADNLSEAFARVARTAAKYEIELEA